MKIGVDKTVSSTQVFDFLYGKFNLSEWSIPYFSTVMDVEDIGDSLRMVNEFPGWESNNWTLEELFQREVDWGRVKNSIVPYLKNDKHPQFFNSITVALLPTLHGEITEYTDERLEAPDLRSTVISAENVRRFGPLTVGYYGHVSEMSDEAARLGRFCWNPRQAFCVAIDGQHRLAALKDLKGKGVSFNTQIPVIVVFLDPRLGFHAPGGEQDPVPVLRKLFIDLNKHAVRVTRSRMILLDDRDPTALCVRRIVGERLEDDFASLQADDVSLPLGLVDWHSDSTKFDDGPYITTILGLDWIVQNVVKIGSIKDYTDYKRIRNQIRAMESVLGVNLANAKRRLELAEERERPFAYEDSSGGRDSELDLIAEAFDQTWKGAIVSVLSGFQPYAHLIRLREVLGLTDALFAQWYQLRSGGGELHPKEREVLEGLEARLEDADRSAVDLEKRLQRVEADKGGSLAFNVAFQRALLVAFGDWARVSLDDAGLASDLSEEWADDPDAFYDELEEESSELDTPPRTAAASDRESAPAARAREFVEAMNRLVECWPEVLDPRAVISEEGGIDSQLWLGTLWRAEQTIDFSKGASVRAASLLKLTVAMWHGLKTRDPVLAEGFDSYWESVLRGNLKDTAVRRLASGAATAFMRTNRAQKSAALRIVGEDATQADLERVLRERAKRLFEAINGG